MKIREIMTKPVATCQPGTNLAEAAALMWENDCGALPVLNETGELAGIVTDRDICIALGTRNLRASDLCVKDLLGNQTLSCRASDEVSAVLRTMRDGKVRRLPVVDHVTHVEGIISMDDVVMNARSGISGTSSPISFEEAVATLQAIYSRGGQMQGRTAAA
jgi:CBS domain-containing protein